MKEVDLSISELMNYGMNYGTSVPIDINELEKLFDKKEDRKEFHKYIDVIKKDLIEKYKLPKYIVNAYIENGRIFSFEHDSMKKAFYFDYYTLLEISCAYFLDEKEAEEFSKQLFCLPMDEAKIAMNKRLKELRTQLNNIDEYSTVKNFMDQHVNFLNGTLIDIFGDKKEVNTNGREYMSQIITDFIVNHKYLLDFFQKNCVNNAMLDGINKEKFLFYLAGSTLQKCFQFEEVDPAIYYAINYYLHKTEEGIPNIKITVGENSYSFLTFSKQLQAYLKTHPNVGMRKFKPDTFKGCTPEEVKGYLLELQNETLQNFDVVDTDDVYLPNGVDTGVKRGKSTGEKSSRKTAEVSKLTLQKRKFYRENKEQIYMTLRGKNKFNGYVAHVFKNGYVVFEKHDRQSNMISNQSGAAYIMTIHNFNEFSKKTIPEIREYVKKNPDGDISYLCHSGNWMERLQRVIDQTTGIDLSEIDRVMMKYKTNN